ncbi:hypothetical protein BD410DRAFT_829475 [Rickenella mellea]|uniref:Aminoglycoside phosphotransferase domain-containing protein n=1 Tax=Rickenella mellea TaxID=50990 RepID=A0A4Y7Q0K5_9AGAM|nr:hypothetical protein BD410DRAFT_829475 [Rickenella mellea]
MTTPGRLRSGRLFPAPSANPSNSSQQNLPKYRKEMTDREIVQLWMDSAAPATFRVKRLFADAEVKLTNRGSIADEASAIQLVTERTKIPIPEILRTVEDRGDGYIIMDYKGPRLSDVWGSLTKEQRTSIVLILRGYIDQLRAIEPQDFPGPGPVPRLRLLKEFFNEMEHIRCAEDVEETKLKRFDDSSQFALTHNNIGMHNIIVGKDNIYLSNWEDAGFYPQWFDMVAMKRIAKEVKAPISWVRNIPTMVGHFRGKEEYLERMGCQLMCYSNTKTEAKYRPRTK